MQHVVLDLETNGLRNEATCIHSMVLRDVDTDEVLSCSPHDKYQPLALGLEVLKKAHRVYGHKLIGFDRPVLNKLMGYEIPWERVRDTLTIAQMRWAHVAELDYSALRKGMLPPGMVGKHSLEAWGYRLGILKGTYGKTADWSRWTPEMQAYCEQDTAVTRALVLHIRKHGVSELAVICEQELALYLDQQERNGWPFDVAKATALQAKLAARREEVAQDLRKTFGSWYRSRGEQVPKVNNKTRGITKGCAFTKLERIDFNPGSRAHIADRLGKLYGWVPEQFTPSGQPQIDDQVIAKLPQEIPGVRLLSEYLLLDKRLGQLAEGDKAWLRKFTDHEPDGGKLTGLQHVHGGVKQSGTITHRAAHIDPNLGQVPKVGAPFGAECRELFCVPPGWVQVGADQSSLEARCLCHYMHPYDGGAYGKVVLEGDVHSLNRAALGLPAVKVARDGAKNWFYAFMYGAGDLKLGRMLWETMNKIDPSLKPMSDAELAALGKKKKAQFLKSTPALARLVETVKAKAREQGFLTTIDGRRVYVRSEHAALNTLLQCAGAVICKWWIVMAARALTEELGPQGWTGQWAALGWIHDEVQIACKPEVAQRVCEILTETARFMTWVFGWRVQLDGEAKVGRNWMETH